MQITSGIRSILSHPAIYRLSQKIMSSEKAKKELYSDIAAPTKGDNVLDIGCGPAISLNYLGDVNYWGYDISSRYIASAKAEFGNKGKFFCKYFEEADLENIPSIDICIMSGVLHHMSEAEANRVLKIVAKALGKEGRLITYDPVFTTKQNPIARFLISKDRGQNVRTESGYSKLLAAHFDEIETLIKHKFFIPYTSCICIASF